MLVSRPISLKKKLIYTHTDTNKKIAIACCFPVKTMSSNDIIHAQISFYNRMQIITFKTEQPKILTHRSNGRTEGEQQQQNPPPPLSLKKTINEWSNNEKKRQKERHVEMKADCETLATGGWNDTTQRNAKQTNQTTKKSPLKQNSNKNRVSFRLVYACVCLWLRRSVSSYRWSSSSVSAQSGDLTQLRTRAERKRIQNGRWFGGKWPFCKITAATD